MSPQQTVRSKDAAATVRAPFTRITSPGLVPSEGRLFVTIQWDGTRLSITGVVGPCSNGNCVGSCGQTGIPDDLRPAKDWTADQVAKLRATWDRWHLNDTRAGCEHQRDSPEWNVTAPLELCELSWGTEFTKAQNRASAGKMTPAEYVEYGRRREIVYRLTIEPDRPKSPDLWGDDASGLLRDGWITEGKRETKTAGWVSPAEHPGGLLGKPCPTCGYRYGTAWLYEDVPDDVLEFLRGLPDHGASLPALWHR